MLTLTAALIILSVTSCNPTHEHVFSEWETETESTCTSFGLNKRTCECGQVEYDTVAAFSHTPITDEAVSATCTSNGKTEGSHCKDCGAVITAQTETEKLAHGFGDWETVTAPTCTSFGLKKRACECGATEYDTFDALTHTRVTDAATPATCTSSGKTEGSHCDTCGVIIVHQSTVAPTGHSFGEIAVIEEALCNSNGTKRFTCTNLGCSYYYDESYSLSALDSSEIYAEAAKYTGTLQIFDRFGNFMNDSSAFVISADGKIITSTLPIDNAYSLVFILEDTYYDVTEVLAYSDESKIAVLKIDATDLPYAKICTREVTNGETVYLMGAPEGLTKSLMSGVISNADLVFDGITYIQHDITAKSGCVGSPLINKYGEVIGINAGYIGEDLIGAAAHTSKIEALDYSSPMSVYEYGNLTYTPKEQLDNWVVNNYNGTTDGAIAYVVQGNGFYYSLGYDLASDYSFVEGYWSQDENYQLYVRVFLNNSEGTYQYLATMTDGVRQNEVVGFIDAETYTASTVLTYDTYYGRYWTESELMALYSDVVYDTIGFFSYCLDTYFDTVTLESFGFTSVSYERDEEALAKLQRFTSTYGGYEPLTGSYVLSGGSQMGEDTMQFNISYHVETGDTVVSVHYILASGTKYSAYLNLNAGENGNRFDFMCTNVNGEEFTVQNLAWGYLDAGSFTSTTKLTCYEFIGMNEYEDGLLMDYTMLLDYMMRLLNDSVMPSVGPELSVKDLGFLFYFG